MLLYMYYYHDFFFQIMEILSITFMVPIYLFFWIFHNRVKIIDKTSFFPPFFAVYILCSVMCICALFRAATLNPGRVPLISEKDNIGNNVEITFEFVIF